LVRKNAAFFKLHYLSVNQKNSTFSVMFLTVARWRAKKSIDRFFHAEHLFEKKSHPGEFAKVGFGSEKQPSEAEKLHDSHKVCSLQTPLFRFKGSKNGLIPV